MTESEPLSPDFDPANADGAMRVGPPEHEVSSDAGVGGLPRHLDNLADRARDYAKASSSDNTRRAYASDWAQFATWCRRQRLATSPPDPQTVGLYITTLASGAATASHRPASVATIERRLSALTWTYAQAGEVLDRDDRHIATVLAGIRRTQGKPPAQKEAVLSDDIKAMIATLDLGDLRGLRDRAILLIGFAGGLRRSEIIGLDCGADQTQDGGGWIEILDKGLLLRIRGKTG